MTSTRNDLLFLDTPASRWIDAFPLGNGKLGVMLFGGVAEERLALNHENLWRGVTRERTTSPKHQHLDDIRAAFFAKKWLEGTELATKYLSGAHQVVQPYQPVGDLRLRFPAQDSAVDYRRELNIRDAMGAVTYRAGDTVYKRETFVSADYGVIVLRLTANRSGAITCEMSLDRVEDEACTLTHWAKDASFGYAGHFVEGIDFAVEARVTTKGGAITAGEGASLKIDGADEALIVMTIAVDYNQPQPADWCARHLDGVPMDYDKLRAAHLAEFRPYYDRVSLEVGCNPQAEVLPVNKRLELLRNGGDDPGMVALYFNYGRYLLISSSRKCDQPMNAVGIWSYDLFPPWESDLHNDVNIQMAYWPAEVCNLTDCLPPFFGYMNRCIPQGKKAARDLYNCGGIYICIQTDIWGRVTPESPGWDVWTGAAAWLAQHLWWRYEYSLDTNFLREQAYPFIKMVAEFYEDYLVHDADGYLVTVPSQSPENTFVGGAYPVSLCVGATMDFLFIREVLENCLRSIDILGIDEEKRGIWEGILRDLPPYKIGRNGQLQEWLEDFEESEPGHRHISHLYGVHPGDSMTPERQPEFYQAARVSLERRLAAGGGHTGWSRSWVAAQWARHGEGELAYDHLIHLITDFATDALLDLHPYETKPDGVVFQIDGNFGGTAGIAELLMQSHAGVIRILPALPSHWPTGKITGLRARNGFGLNLSWRDGKLEEAVLTSDLGQPLTLSCPKNAEYIFMADGEEITPGVDEHGFFTLPTNPGQRIVVRIQR